MRVELPLKMPVTAFVQVVGFNNKVREFQAILDTGSTHSVISLKEALDLGYDAYYPPDVGEVGTRVVMPRGILECKMITLKEVRLGELKVLGLEAVAIGLPEQSGVIMLLGTNFLKSFKTTIDYGRGTLTIEEIK